MRMNAALIWEHGPSTGRIVITGGTLIAGTILVGWGQYKDGQFSFTDDGPAHICLAVDVNEGATVGVQDTERPFTIAFRDIPKEDPIKLQELGVQVTAEEDAWANL